MIDEVLLAVGVIVLAVVFTLPLEVFIDDLDSLFCGIGSTITYARFCVVLGVIFCPRKTHK